MNLALLKLTNLLDLSVSGDTFTNDAVKNLINLRSLFVNFEWAV